MSNVKLEIIYLQILLIITFCIQWVIDWLSAFNGELELRSELLPTDCYSVTTIVRRHAITTLIFRGEGGSPALVARRCVSESNNRDTY